MEDLDESSFGIKDEIFTILHKDIFISYKILRLIEVG